MCYSAQIAESYHKYLRLTGAEMDIDQFLELVGFRAAGAPVRIPRAVDRWFRDPDSDAERAIRDRIDQYRASMVTKLEKELFTQRRRLVDAERTLAVKPTRTGPSSPRARLCTTKAALFIRGPLATARKSARCLSRSMMRSRKRGPFRRSDACGHARGGRQEPCGRRSSPDGRESRGGACAPVCWVGKSASRVVLR